jgi:hypothetical protein
MDQFLMRRRAFCPGIEDAWMSAEIKSLVCLSRVVCQWWGETRQAAATTGQRRVIFALSSIVSEDSRFPERQLLRVSGIINLSIPLTGEINLRP